MSTLKITKLPTNANEKHISQKATDPYLKITKIPTTTSNKGGWKGHSPSISKKENHAGDVTLDTNPEETCPETNPDNNNNPIDELTYQDIPEENLIRIRGNGHLHCYDATTLKRIVDEQKIPKEPMTQIPLPDSIITVIKDHSAQFSPEVKESIELGRQQRRDEADRTFAEWQQRQQAPQQANVQLTRRQQRIADAARRLLLLEQAQQHPAYVVYPTREQQYAELDRVTQLIQQERLAQLNQQQQQVRSQIPLAQEQFSELLNNERLNRERSSQQVLTPEERLRQEQLAQQRRQVYRQLVLEDDRLTQQIQQLLQ